MESGARALAATVTGREELAQDCYERAFDSGIRVEAMAEVARMSHLFGGFPRAIQGLRAISEAARRRGVAPPERGPEADRDALRRRGRALFESIYADQSEAVLRSIDSCMPGFTDWILEHAYGRVLSRPGLEARVRELMAVAALTVLRCPAQLVSHARGALRLGASRDDLMAVLDALERDFGGAALAEARELVYELSPG